MCLGKKTYVYIYTFKIPLLCVYKNMFETIYIYPFKIAQLCVCVCAHLTLVLVQMMYSISSEYGFWKVNELVRIRIHSPALVQKRNITERTCPRSFTTCVRGQTAHSFLFSYLNLTKPLCNINKYFMHTHTHTCWRLSLRSPWSSGWANSRKFFPKSSYTHIQKYSFTYGYVGQGMTEQTCLRPTWGW